MATARPSGDHSDRGQATLEYAALLVLVAVVVAVIAALAGPSLPGSGLIRAVAGGLLCAIDPGSRCGAGPGAGGPSPLEAAYGSELAEMVERSAPDIFFEGDDFASLPVDFRDCRSRSCADTIRRGAVRATQTGLQPTVFTHVVDCRPSSVLRVPAGGEGADCSGSRSGHVYVQYWLYYPDSLTHGLGRVGGYHHDDWESFQTRIDQGGSVLSRASSHHGYNGRSGGIGSIGSDTGWSPRTAWEPGTRALHVAAGSHAGTTQPTFGDVRAIHREDLVLIPAEPIAATSRAGFAISPPWEKQVWLDPEATGT